jgi:hypothetical protein
MRRPRQSSLHRPPGELALILFAFAQVNDLLNLFLCVFAVYFFRKPEMAAVNADLESKINHVDYGVRRCPGL